jgi:hypothetical protein
MRKASVRIVGFVVLGLLLTPGIGSTEQVSSPVGCVAQVGGGHAVIQDHFCNFVFPFSGNGAFHYRILRASQWHVRACGNPGPCNERWSGAAPRAGVINAPGPCPCYADLEIFDKAGPGYLALGILVKGKVG